METITIIKLKKCAWCGSEFIPQHNRQTYCTENGTYCRDEARREQGRKARLKHYNTYKDILSEEQRYGLGGSMIGGHMNNNVNEEYRIVHKEKIRLKI